MKRFIVEYANNKKGRIKKYGISEERREACIKEVDRILKMYERGFITIDEAMERIAKV